MKYLAPIPKQFVDQNGLPLSDGKVHVYISGDTQYANVYQDADGDELMPNPARLDSNGAWLGFVTAGVTLDYVVEDKEGNVQFEYEKVVAGGDGGGGGTISAVLPLKVADDVLTNNGSHLTCTGINAWAEGQDTESTGVASHAEGLSTIAKTDGAHAEGNRTLAKGYYSHAEGQETVAGDLDSFDGYSAHAEGMGSYAKGSYSHAEGYYSKANGTVSHAEGDNTNADGQRSHAEGNYTVAKGDNSHAEGYYSHAYGASSHAEGDSQTGSSVDPTKGEYAHAEGRWTYATGAASHSEGQGSNATGDASHAEGLQSLATSQASHAEGAATADANYSHAEGASVSRGAYSHAEGYSAQSKGDRSHAEGYETTAQGENSHSEGYNTNAYGTSSHAEGISTHTGDALDSTKGSGAHSEGYSTEASGDHSHSEGDSTIASGENSHAQGLGTRATGANSTAIGKYNDDGTALFVVGNGTDDAHRSDAFKVDENGNTWMKVAGTLKEFLETVVSGTTPISVTVSESGGYRVFNVGIPDGSIDRDKLSNWHYLVPDSRYVKFIDLGSAVVVSIEPDFLATLQTLLTAGAGINITGDTISATTQSDWAQTDVDDLEFIKNKPLVVVHDHNTKLQSTFTGEQNVDIFGGRMTLKLEGSTVGSDPYKKLAFSLKANRGAIGIYSWACVAELHDINNGNPRSLTRILEGSNDYKSLSTDGVGDVIEFPSDTFDAMLRLEIDYDYSDASPTNNRSHGTVYVQRGTTYVIVSTRYEESV